MSARFVVVLEERDEARRERQLLRRQVHVVNRAGVTKSISPPPARTSTRAAVIVPSPSTRALGLGDDVVVLVVGGEIRRCRADAARSTLRYGVSMNPKRFTRPKLESEPMRPMFGPSGVAIGHMRP